MAWWPRLSSSSNDPSAVDLLEVGRIEKAHGLRGEVFVGLVTNMVEARTAVGALFFADGEQLTVISSRPHKNKWLMTFEGYRDRNAVETLRGRVLWAKPLDDDSLAAGESGEIATEVVAFVHDLIDKQIVDQNGVGHSKVVAVIDNPASDLLELDDGRLVPLSFYQHHDDSQVFVDVPPGLLDDGAVVADEQRSGHQAGSTDPEAADNPTGSDG